MFSFALLRQHPQGHRRKYTYGFLPYQEDDADEPPIAFRRELDTVDDGDVDKNCGSSTSKEEGREYELDNTSDGIDIQTLLGFFSTQTGKSQRMPF